MNPYYIVRSKRKTIAIYITKEGAIEVRAPLKASKSIIDKFVQSKESWITKHLSDHLVNLSKKEMFLLNYGDTALLCGKQYPIVAGESDKLLFENEQFILPPPSNLSHTNIKYAMITLYIHIAKQILTDKVITFAKEMDVKPTAIKVNSAKTRWGSCSGKNSINFSWRLILADDDVIDYVVVHELAHIKEHNHSSRFWEIVKTIFPDYISRQEKLKLLQKKFTVEDWD